MEWWQVYTGVAVVPCGGLYQVNTTETDFVCGTIYSFNDVFV